MCICSNHLYSRRYLILILIIGVGTIVWLFFGIVFVPKLVVSDLDLGVFQPGQVVERVLSIENRGWKSLVIDDVNTCCGVTLPFDYPKKIRSRSASFVVLRMRLPFTYNPWNRTLLLKTNDRNNPTTKIHIRAQPDLAMKIVPPAVNMGYIIADKHFADVAKIRTTTETKISRYITASSPY